MAHGLKASYSGTPIDKLGLEVDALVIDVSHMAQRQAHALSKFKTSDGRPSGHVYGSFRQIASMVWMLRPRHLVFAYDRECTWRRALVPSYKSNRRPVDASADAWTPAPDVERFCRSLPGIHLAEDGCEADDMIALYAACSPRALRNKPIALSSADRDLYQVVSDAEDVALVLSKKPKPGAKSVHFLIREDEVAEEFGVTPAYVARVKALLGDDSDNLKGLVGASRPGKKEALRKLVTQPDADDYFDPSKPMPQFLFMPDWLIPELQNQRDQMITNLEICDLSKRRTSTGVPPPTDGDLAQSMEVLLEFECESLLSQMKEFHMGLLEARST